MGAASRSSLVDALDLDARAKVNLRLRIFPADAGGYHPIETAFCRISLRDRVRLRRARRGVRLSVSGDAPRGRGNLAVRAAEAFLREVPELGGVEIELVKAIPAAAGLGGGSSDAAAVLRGLNRLAGDPLPGERLLAIGAALGADVPFFVLDAPLAYGWGRGDRLEPLGPLPPVPALVVRPPIALSTAEAYRAWDAWASRHGWPAGGAGSDAGAPAAGRRGRPDWRSWEEAALQPENDFEPVVFERHPELVEIKRRLLESGPYFALLSGSGPSFFAAYPTRDARDAARQAWPDAPGAQVFSVTAPD